MILTFTKEEQLELRQLEDKYSKLIEEKRNDIKRHADPNNVLVEVSIPIPDAPEYPENPTKKSLAEYEKKLKEYEELVARRNEEVNRNYKEWLSKGSPEWRQAREDFFRLQDEFVSERKKFLSACERRHFAQLGGDRNKIIADARSQAETLISNRYNYYKKIAETGIKDGKQLVGFSSHELRVDGSEIWLDSQMIIESIRENLELHYEALKNDLRAVEEINQIVIDVVTRSPYVSSEKGDLGARLTFNPLLQVKTTRPEEMIAVTAKVAQETFLGDFNPAKGKRVNVQKKTQAKKNPVYTLISISFDELKDKGVEIRGRRELTSFDQEIHDAFVSHALSGNEYITDSMIFDTISGKDGATLNQKQQEAISNSITKLMYSHVKIDASEEAQKFGIEKFIYDGSILPAERLTVSINGTVTECVHIFRTPPLYDYADRLSQVGRMDVKLLNSPVNKDEETIALQGYLYRRILSMKGSQKLPPTIVYDTLYKQLELSASSEGALRKKKLKVREKVKRILEYWKSEKFIKGYVENKHKSEKGKIVSVTIRL